MQGMLPVKRTILLKLKLFLGITPVLLGGIVLPFTLGTLERHQLHGGLFTGHKPLLPSP
jgi:hypothetical protein